MGTRLTRSVLSMSLTIDSAEADSPSADMLNRAIWHSAKGFETPYNSGRSVRRDGVALVSSPRLAGL